MRTTLCILLSASWLLGAPIPALAQEDGNPPPVNRESPAQPDNGAASAPAALAAPPANHTPGVEETAASCRARWKEYRDSLACFAPYRHSQHVLDVEAYKHCKVVKEPTDCPPEYK
jgi:hypothetical protein